MRWPRKLWTPEKKIWKHLELEFIHHEQTPKERITHFEEIRIRFIVCLSFIKLNWWQAMDFAYYLFFLKRIEKWHVANLRRSSWTTDRIGKNEWIDMMAKEEECWRNHHKNSKMTDEREWNTGKNFKMNKDTWTPPTKSWWALEEKIKSWRTTIKNSGDQRMMR